ncbi:60S ribosomal protein [Aspergillus rambellii]|uniref:60S ribosomal protein L29 n=2 Tax=Aspergillus subgen. Nidulantes TaxID=2720870 RepID=A0A0F8TXN0_9EURO|nr:60S ribosomal protein [Aspergillus rambellii]
MKGIVSLIIFASHSIKKPKTHRYPSLKGVDPKFRRNHRHALHGTMKALKERKEGKREVA